MKPFALTALILMAAPAAAQTPPPPGPAPAAVQGPATLAEFQAHARARMMAADADHDGRISLAEWMAWRAARGERHGDPARMFERLDLNHDGYITPDEVDAMSTRRFARMDADHDGVLSPDEAAARHGRGEPADTSPPQQ